MQHSIDRVQPVQNRWGGPGQVNVRVKPGQVPRVAIVHYWLVGMRGGEKVLEALLRMFPQADIFTHVYDPDSVSDLIRSKQVYTTSISKLPMAKRLYQNYLPFMPRALEEIDLADYDIVLSSESGPSKGVIPAPDALHLCYCHSPMRYLWDQYHQYRGGAGLVKRTLMPRLIHGLRQWDVTSAARVDGFIANSAHVRSRIGKYWRRDAAVVYPPVAVDDFEPVAPEEVGEYYLWAGELVGYKRPDLMIDAFNKMGKPLLVIGGPSKAEKALAARANENIRFLGRVPFEKLKAYMARCKALVFPGEEDFGIIPVEVMASGRPVIAYGRGGALDTVIDRKTGLLFDDQSVEGLIKAIETFEAEKLDKINPQVLVSHAQQFEEANFRRGIESVFRDFGVTFDADHTVKG